MKKSNHIFMAFATGSESTEAVEFKKYIGLGGAFIKAVNPTKAELEKLYGRDMQNEPEYLSEKDGVKSIRITFVCQFDPQTNNGIDEFVNVSFFLKNEQRKGSQSGKIQIIDKYGRTAWADPDVVAAKGIPQYSNGPAKIDANYRPAYVGEEELISFLKTYLGIENIDIYKDNTWVTNPKPENCEAALEQIAQYFSGNVQELKSIIGLQPNNKIKILVGVRTTEDGRSYPDVFTRAFLKNNSNATKYLKNEVEQVQGNGGYANSEFLVNGEIVPLQEYVVTPTNFKQEDAPFEAPSNAQTPW